MGTGDAEANVLTTGLVIPKEECASVMVTTKFVACDMIEKP